MLDYLKHVSCDKYGKNKSADICANILSRHCTFYIYIYTPTCTLFPNALPILHVTVWGSTRATDWTQTIPVDIPLLWAIKAKVIREMVKENIKQFFHSEFFVLGTRMCLAFNIIILGKLTGRGYKIKKGILFFSIWYL